MPTRGDVPPIGGLGVFLVSLTGPEGASDDYTRSDVIAIENALQPIVAQCHATVVQSFVAPAWGGRPSPVNSAFIVVRLKDWDLRDVKQQEKIGRASWRERVCQYV